MLLNVSSPWASQKRERVKAVIVMMIAFMAMIWSFTAIFSSHTAFAQNSQKCDSFVVIGDYQGVRDVKAGLDQKIKDKFGVDDVSTAVYNGRSTNEVASQIEKSDINGKCVIVESGTMDLQKSKGEMEKSIRRASRALSGAKQVYWVTPVVDDARVGNKYHTKKFADALRNSAGKNINVVNVQQLSVDSNLFEDDGIRMTDEGYEKRIGLIVNRVERDNKKQDDKDKSKSSTPTPAPGGGSGTGTGNQGGGGQGSSDPWGGTGSGGIDGGESGETDDTVQNPEPDDDGNPGIDYSKVSPLSMANKARNIGTSSAANNYLMVSRWENLEIPSQEIKFTSLSSIPTTLMGAGVEKAYGGTRIFYVGLVALAEVALGDVFASWAIKIADGIFARLAGGPSASIAKMSVIATSLITVALMFSLARAMDTKSRMSGRQRVMGMVQSVGKAVGGLIIIMAMSFQSAKNSNGEDYETGVSEMLEGMKSARDKAKDRDFDNENMDTGEGSKQAADFSTWQPLSLGWFLSLGYFMGNQVAGAFLNIGNAVLLAPMEMTANAMFESNAKNVNPACDRFVDAMNVTYRSTKYASSRPAMSSAISSIDFMYYKMALIPYKHAWGGKNFQSSNSFCINLESKSNKAAGDTLMLARTAGLYKEVAGSGNLIHYSGMSEATYTNGRHTASNPAENFSHGLPSLDGLLVDSKGNWQNNDEKGTYRVIARARNYLSGGTDVLEDRNPGIYYFASCVWEPDKNGAKAHSSVKKASAMGPSGVADKEKDMPPLEVEIKVRRKTKKYLEQSESVVNNSGRAGTHESLEKTKKLFDETRELGSDGEEGEGGEDNAPPPEENKDDNNDDNKDDNKDGEDKDANTNDEKDDDESNAETGDSEAVKIPSPTSRRISDFDCSNDFIVNLDDIKSEAMTGFNSQNHWAQRWDYTPAPPRSLMEVSKNVYDRIAGKVAGWLTTDNDAGLQEKNGEEDGGEPDENETLEHISKDNPAIDPKVAFNDLVDGDTSNNPAKDFWEHMAGKSHKGGAMFVSAISFTAAATAALVLGGVLAMILGINLVLSLFLMFAGFMFIVYVFQSAIKGVMK